jgi:hypothetical protein
MAKVRMALLARLRFTKSHAEKIELSPDRVRCSPHARECILQIEGLGQPAGPTGAQLGTALGLIADADRHSTTTGNDDLRGPIKVAARYPSALHAYVLDGCSSAAAQR